MKIKSLGITLFSLFALGKAKNFNFNVVSILGEGSSLGVKYGNTVTPLTASQFPLFTGVVNADNIDEYKYVSLDKKGNVIGEENINRKYTDETAKINEVYNRTNKKVELPKLPKPFKDMFPMGTDKYQPLPNVVYNVYANCEKKSYTDLVTRPFLEEDEQNEGESKCNITIVSPEEVFQTTGSVHVIGYGSRLYKKLSWTIKFDEKFMGRKAVKMRAMANDPSLVREKFASELYKSAGIPVQECTYARFFINGDSYGLFTMSDSLNRKWLKNYIHGDSQAKIGYAYKMDSSWPEGPYADFKYVSDDFNVYRETWSYFVDEYEKPKGAEIDQEDPKNWEHLINFIKLYKNWVDKYGNDNSDTAVQELEKFFNVESLLRVLAVESLTVASDNFWVIMGNSDLYYNPEKNYYQILPFDFDRLLSGPLDNPLIDPEGYMVDCLNWAYYGDGKDTLDHYFTKNIMKHPQIKNRYDVILAKISKYNFDKGIVQNYISKLTELIREDVEWNFEQTNKLKIPYKGIVNKYTIKDYEDNMVNRNISLSDFKKPYANEDDSIQVDLMQFIEMRGDSCRAYTSNVDIEKNKDDKYDITLTDDVFNLESGASTLKATTILLALSYLLYFIIF